MYYRMKPARLDGSARFLLIASLLIFGLHGCAGALACNETTICEEQLGPGSVCRQDGTCSNRFEYGCLARKLPSAYGSKTRACNSEDSDSTKDNCRQPEFDYMEIRISSQNWESVYFEAWLLQIILSELLGVPTTIESGGYDANVNLYNVDSRFDYGPNTVWTWEGLQRSHEIGDCRLAKRDNAEDYQPCTYAVPEYWSWPDDRAKQSIDEGHMEHPTGLDAFGLNGWYVPKFTAERNPSLLSTFGLQGEGNRKTLADTFKRPTTWKDYCEIVSTSNCTIPDEVAERPPQDEREENRMFVDGLYTGHFRATHHNNCTANPKCTGSFQNYGCGWISFVQAQTYHLNIALESNGPDASGGYPYSQLVEIWQAANATKSDVIGIWWMPDAVYQRFQGTDAEFQRINLPTPSQACVNARITVPDRCSDNFTERVGDPLGTCDEAPTPLQKLVSSALYNMTKGPSIPEALRNPAYDVVKQFRISSLQLGEIFEYWERMKDPREALCSWAVDNLDYVTSFVPRSYPRTIRKEDENDPLRYGSAILASIATLLVVVIAGMTFRQRKRRVMVIAQVEFLWLLLAGLLIIALGALVISIPPSDASCVAAAWLIHTGYTLELVPLCVKVAAINKLMSAAERMRRVVLSRAKLFGIVCALVLLVTVFLATWTALDPPKRQAEYYLGDATTDDGATIVRVHYYCRSNSDAWQLAAVAWNSLLLIWSTALAFQSRKIQQEGFNEAQTLAMMIYSHFVFVVLRFILFFVSRNDATAMSNATLNISLSLIYSSDILATIFIYFVPKLLSPDVARSTSVYFGGAAKFSRMLAPFRSLGNSSPGPETDSNDGPIAVESADSQPSGDAKSQIGPNSTGSGLLLQPGSNAQSLKPEHEKDDEMVCIKR